MKYILSIKEYLARKEELKSRYGFEVSPMPDIDMDINFQNKNGVINIKRREYHRFIHFDKSFKLHINEEEMSSNSRINFKISSFGSGNIIENDSELYGGGNFQRRSSLTGRSQSRNGVREENNRLSL